MAKETDEELQEMSYDEFVKLLKKDGRRSTIEHEAFITYHLVYLPIKHLTDEVRKLNDRLGQD